MTTNGQNHASNNGNNGDAASRSAASRSTSHAPRLHVSVIGGGIGGSCMAVGLLRHKGAGGLDVDVFEAASSFGEIGAGISFGLNAQNALRKLGLGEAFDSLADTVPGGQYFQWRRGDGKGSDERLLSETYVAKGNATVHRARLLEMIVRYLPSDVVHFGKRFERVEELPRGETRRYRMYFSDGSTHDTDVVLGCDGVHSNVRKIIRGSRVGTQASDVVVDSGSQAASDLMWSGTWAYRGLIPREKFFAEMGEEKGRLYGLTPQMFLGKDRHILTFPIDDAQTINVVAFTTDRSRWPKRASLPLDASWTQKTTMDDMLADFPGWSDDLLTLLRCVPSPPSKWALHTIDPPLESYVHEGIVVSGDAAHGGCPHHGAMAGQAVEDALFVSTLLGNPSVTRENVYQALQVIDEIRLPRANKVMQDSLALGDKYELASDEFGEDIEKLAQWLVHAWDWIWDYDHDEEWRRAEKWLQERGIVKGGQVSS